MTNFVKQATVARLKKLEAELKHVTDEPKDADAIHDLRVSIRRLRQELRVFQAWFEPAQVKNIRRRLRKLMDRCAAVRNCDVAIEVLREAGYEKPELVAGLEDERRHMRAALARKMESWRRRDRVRKWRSELRAKRPPAEASLQEAHLLLPAMIEDLFGAGEEAARPDSNHYKMHQFRLKAKRVRYTLELFETVYGSKTERIMESLKGLQGKLGAINDCATTLEMIRRDRDAAAAVKQLAGERETEFREYWKQHFGVRERAQWKAVLSAADGKS